MTSIGQGARRPDDAAPSDLVDQRDRLLDARARAAQLVAAMSDEVDLIIESIDNVSNDDEHDPDGSTSGYERAKSTSLLDQARASLEAIDGALVRLDEGDYGACRVCRGPIGLERLEAIPEAVTCIACAQLA